MDQKVFLVICLVCLLGFDSVQAQRDGRRRSGRRKATTVPPTEAVVIESSPEKPDSEAVFDSTKAPSSQESDTHSATNSMSKSDAGGKTQVLAPRGTRKPRPMSPIGSRAEGKPKPTLPTFVRKMSGRTRKTHTVEEDRVAVTPSSANKVGRNSSRRRGSTTSTTISSDSDIPETSSESVNSRGKKRFGGGSTRRSSRGNRRNTTEPTES